MVVLDLDPPTLSSSMFIDGLGGPIVRVFNLLVLCFYFIGLNAILTFIFLLKLDFNLLILKLGILTTLFYIFMFKDK